MEKRAVPLDSLCGREHLGAYQHPLTNGKGCDLCEPALTDLARHESSGNLRELRGYGLDHRGLTNAWPPSHKHVLHALSGVSLLTVALGQQLRSQDPAQAPLSIVVALQMNDSSHLESHQGPVLMNPEQHRKQSAEIG